MNLGKKRELASRALKVGRERIVFVRARFDEIKEAITKKDIIDLKEDGAIKVKEVKGRKKNERRKNARGQGKVKKKVNKRKQIYVKMVRAQRGVAREMYNQKKITREQLMGVRKRIRNKSFKSKTQLKSYLEGLNE